MKDDVSRPSNHRSDGSDGSIQSSISRSNSVTGIMRL